MWRRPLAHCRPTFARIPAGETLQGSTDVHAYPGDGEGPVRSVRIDAFALAPHAVTNREFERFADATGHRSEAEVFGWSFVFGGLLPDEFPPTRGRRERAVVATGRRRPWRTPEGPHSNLDGRAEHPVVHVSWNDAAAYCAWAGRACPPRRSGSTPHAEASIGNVFPWGDDLEPGGSIA